MKRLFIIPAAVFALGYEINREADPHKNIYDASPLTVALANEDHYCNHKPRMRWKEEHCLEARTLIANATPQQLEEAQSKVEAYKTAEVQVDVGSTAMGTGIVFGLFLGALMLAPYKHKEKQ